MKTTINGKTLVWTMAPGRRDASAKLADGGNVWINKVSARCFVVSRGGIDRGSSFASKLQAVRAAHQIAAGVAAVVS